MVGFALIAFPLVLLGFVLLMERVEQPLSQVSQHREVEHFLDAASPAELDTFVREGTESALRRFRRRLRPNRNRRARQRAAS